MGYVVLAAIEALYAAERVPSETFAFTASVECLFWLGSACIIFVIQRAKRETSFSTPKKGQSPSHGTNAQKGNSEHQAKKVGLVFVLFCFVLFVSKGSFVLKHAKSLKKEQEIMDDFSMEVKKLEEQGNKWCFYLPAGIREERERDNLLFQYKGIKEKRKKKKKKKKKKKENALNSMCWDPKEGFHLRD